MQNMQNIDMQKPKISESEPSINSRTCLGHLVLFFLWVLWALSFLFFPFTQPKHKNASDCNYRVVKIVVKSKLVICSDLMKHKPCISWTDPPQRIGLCSSFTPIIIHPDHVMWDSCHHRVFRWYFVAGKKALSTLCVHSTILLKSSHLFWSFNPDKRMTI